MDARTCSFSRLLGPPFEAIVSRAASPAKDRTAGTNLSKDHNYTRAKSMEVGSRGRKKRTRGRWLPGRRAKEVGDLASAEEQ